MSSLLDLYELGAASALPVVGCVLPVEAVERWHPRGVIVWFVDRARSEVSFAMTYRTLWVPVQASNGSRMELSVCSAYT